MIVNFLRPLPYIGRLAFSSSFVTHIPLAPMPQQFSAEFEAVVGQFNDVTVSFYFMVVDCHLKLVLHSLHSLADAFLLSSISPRLQFLRKDRPILRPLSRLTKSMLHLAPTTIPTVRSALHQRGPPLLPQQARLAMLHVMFQLMMSSS